MVLYRIIAPFVIFIVVFSTLYSNEIIKEKDINIIYNAQFKDNKLSLDKDGLERLDDVYVRVISNIMASNHTTSYNILVQIEKAYPNQPRTLYLHALNLYYNERYLEAETLLLQAKIIDN